jgi:hypothetical protein
VIIGLDRIGSGILTISFKVFVAAIAGYVPSAMVRCVAAFMDACYIARRNAINSPALEHFRNCVQTFHQLHTIFVEAGVRTTLSLPRQHALKHFYDAIHLFGSPNGLCSSITESKHIRAVKQPWRRSSRYHALAQMLRTLQRMDKMSAIGRYFKDGGLLRGFGFPFQLGNDSDVAVPMDDSDLDELEDEAVVSGKSQDVSEFDVQLATKFRACTPFWSSPLLTYQTFRIWLPISTLCTRGVH